MRKFNKKLVSLVLSLAMGLSIFCLNSVQGYAADAVTVPGYTFGDCIYSGGYYWSCRDYGEVICTTSDSVNYRVKIVELVQGTADGTLVPGSTRYGTVLVDSLSNPTRIACVNSYSSTYDGACNDMIYYFGLRTESEINIEMAANRELYMGEYYGWRKLSSDSEHSYIGDAFKMVDQIKAAKEDFTLDMGIWLSFPDWVMQAIVDRRDINITIRFTAEGKTYEVLVPKKQKIVLDPEDKYYGYLKLNAMFGMKEVVE